MGEGGEGGGGGGEGRVGEEGEHRGVEKISEVENQMGRER